MKKLIIIIIAVSFAGALHAQQMVTGGVDSVVVGSTMPYAVTPDQNIATMVDNGLMNPSVFRWTMTDESDNVTTTGFTISESPTAGLYSKDSINVEWSAAAGSIFKVKTAEVSQPKFGTACDGNTTELEVHVLEVPTLGFNGSAPFEAGSCGLTEDTLSVNVSGIGPWVVTFSVEYNGSGSPVEHTKTMGSKGMNGDFTLDLILDDQDHLNSGDGIYEVRLVNITDRISSKSLVDVAGNVTTSDAYTIGIYPTPNTGSIRHISN